MKGLVSGIKRMEIHDGDGLRTTVFFKGCPLKCVWCHNPESISFEKQIAYFREKCRHCGACREKRDENAAARCPVNALTVYGREYEPEELVNEVTQDEPFFRAGGGGVTLSGGECLAQPDFAVEVARLLHEKDVSVYVDTCGFVPRRTLERILPFTDRFLYDIKAVDPAVHKACTGQDNALILDNLRFLSDAGADIEIRVPLVVGFNEKEIPAIGALLKDMPGITKVKVLRYHNLAASRYEALEMENTLPPSDTAAEDVERAVFALADCGLNAVNGTMAD
ncbi:MAG: glycyl-radical enzyme activating protein [Clostridia bacterium]|nr:glycyl-radical enzyme activating protein [Clostridia bacterium]